MSRILAAALALGVALPSVAQVVPAANYTDMWWNPNESGWGISMAQHSGSGQSHQLFSVWYTYDPRTPETATSESTDYKPLWLVMPGGTWTSPTTISGDMYVTVGTPFATGWNPSNLVATKVGTYSFNFSSSSTGTFTYNIAPPSGLASTDPAFGLPPMSGSKLIERQTF